ncbi:hypothetical protein [Paenibacillus polymyxa]|uniref:helix-turn-helix domain-containing protein n=1 Tax=Paenibacillus polymyxa TaxID=1406 RepID=UPI00111AA15C|nr:hypothetical protein [Paenibacillus polymyxa]QDA30217.1 hypothetical protein FGY93_25190 [Paenibacillus polymyxa]
MLNQGGAIVEEYTFKELAEELNISVPNLRRWCSMLEEMGYQFERTEDKRRLYKQDRDILEMLIRMKEIFKLEEACRILALYSKAERDRSSEQSVEISPTAISMLKNPAYVFDATIVFEKDLAELKERLYWYGMTATIQHLSERWDTFKHEIGIADRPSAYEIN